MEDLNNNNNNKKSQNSHTLKKNLSEEIIS